MSSRASSRVAASALGVRRRRAKLISAPLLSTLSRGQPTLAGRLAANKTNFTPVYSHKLNLAAAAAEEMANSR